MYQYFVMVVMAGNICNYKFIKFKQICFVLTTPFVILIFISYHVILNKRCVRTLRDSFELPVSPAFQQIICAEWYGILMKSLLLLVLKPSQAFFFIYLDGQLIQTLDDAIKKFPFI